MQAMLWWLSGTTMLAAVYSAGFCPLLSTTAGVQTAQWLINGDSSQTDVPIPAQETSLYCQRFPIAADQEYDLIAFEPVIDKAEYYHHAVVFACPDAAATLLSQAVCSKPFACGMSGTGTPINPCFTLIYAWATGGQGWCLKDTAAIRIGKNKIKNVMLQVHWNNPSAIPNIIDKSGIKIYYIQKARPQSVSMLLIEQRHITIPPGDKEWSTTITVPSSCSTSSFDSNLRVADSASSHMHLTGTHSSLTVTTLEGQVCGKRYSLASYHLI